MDVKPGTSKRVLLDDPDSSAQVKKPRTDDYDVDSSGTVEPDTTVSTSVVPPATSENLDQSSSESAVNKNLIPENDSSDIEKLSDDVLLILLSYLNSSDLYNLSRCNRRFYDICADKTLWNRVYAICDGKCPPHGPLLSYLHESTTSLEFRKMKTDTSDTLVSDTCFGDEFFKRLAGLKKLKTLAVENHRLSAEKLILKFLPQSITELRLNGTSLVNHVCGLTKMIFFGIDHILPNLEVVDVSYCQWFNPHLLVPLAKCARLKTLKLIGCRNLKNFIPYASIGASFGFCNLETLDMRLTDVGDREISCFHKVKSLKHIYLERPEHRVQLVNGDGHEDSGDDEEESITDICTTMFGLRNHFREPVGNRVVICAIPLDGGNSTDHLLETLVVRNYPKITDLTLKHADKCLKSLKYLDVTGSNCSEAQKAVEILSGSLAGMAGQLRNSRISDMMRNESIGVSRFIWNLFSLV